MIGWITVSKTHKGNFFRESVFTYCHPLILANITRRDIIDHEPANGNIYKMILGSLDSKFDEEVSTITSEDDTVGDRYRSSMMTEEPDSLVDTSRSTGYGGKSRPVPDRGNQFSTSGKYMGGQLVGA